MKITGYGMTRSEKDKEDIEMLFGTPQERKKARRKEYYLAHREKELAASRAWRETNKERYVARNKAYREKNKERLNAATKKYREQKRRIKDVPPSSGIDVRSRGPSERPAGT